jgi:hypothetical protein
MSYSLYTPRTLASLVLGDSRRSTCRPEVCHAVFLAPPRILATSDGRALRECLPDTRLAPNVPPGVVGHSRVEPHEFRWVTTRPDPTTGSPT